ncbi:alpha-L-rhamnosidase [Microbacterium testaceum]|uniref:alpha-L-rhamnosidase n=1 Tax=Microbacterium testaceum TaxID=2033 RepID=UPI00278334B1|nr:alpha-L-rhamnosidase [Microbacterium testaceum]MDQ1172029.1 alpha-L-rhamnosidase [Microbacterium testaceum]
MTVDSVPHALSVDAGGDDIVVTDGEPRLSWMHDGPAGARYEVEARVDDGDSTSAEVTGQRFVPWPFASLPSRARVAWRVRSVGASQWSEQSSFEVGLLDADWTASWISPEGDAVEEYGTRPAFLLSRVFELNRTVTRARLYATALGVYTVTVNGRRVGSDELAPGSTSYDRTLYAQAHDISALLRPGSNRIEVELSDGWFRGQVGAFRLPAQWGTVTGVRAEVHVEASDGASTVVVTDGTWSWVRSRITRADLMAGQSEDLTQQPSASRPVAVGRVEAPPIEWSPAPPVRVVAQREVVASRRIADHTWVLDFGQNASGWLRMTELGSPGTRTVIDYGEYLDADGDLSTSHLDSARPGEAPIPFLQRDEVIAGGGDEVFEPRHTVHGFQFARVTRAGGAFDPTTATMQVVHTDLVRVGDFACSDPDLNRLHEIARWSFLGNAVDVPTDCPTRERLAWTGDYGVFAPTATRLYDVRGFTAKWLRSVRDDQLDDGRIANFSPDGRQIKRHLDDQFAMMTGSAGWGDAIVSVPWEMYAAYGDTELLADNFEAMTRWVEWALETARSARHHSRAQGEARPFDQFLWDGSFHWGEWTEPKPRDAEGRLIDPLGHDPRAWFMADKGEVGTAYLFRSTATLARVADILGRHDEAMRYVSIADSVRDAWRRAYLRPDATTVADTQAAYVRALAFGLIPEEMRDAAVERLVELIEHAGTHLGTGFLSTGDLLPVLADAGRADVAYALLAQRTAPSWLYMVDKGATTIWEDWEGIDENGDAHDSLNHYSKGAVVRFLHTHTLGLRQDDDSIAWEGVVVRPVPGPTVTWARGSHLGPRGPIEVEWRRDDSDFHLHVEIPPATIARVILPDGRTHVCHAGRHDFASTVSASELQLSAR